MSSVHGIGCSTPSSPNASTSGGGGAGAVGAAARTGATGAARSPHAITNTTSAATRTTQRFHARATVQLSPGRRLLAEDDPSQVEAAGVPVARVLAVAVDADP